MRVFFHVLFLTFLCSGASCAQVPSAFADESEPLSPGADAAGQVSEAEEASSAQASTSAPTAEEAAEAAERFARGLKFYEEGDYTLALIEFERAYRLVPNYRVLYNIGQVSIQLSRFARARIALTRYLNEGGAELSAQRKEEIARDLEMLSARTAYLNVTAEADADLIIDDQNYGKFPIAEPILLDAGEHKLTVTKEGFVEHHERLILAGAETVQLQITLKARPLVAHLDAPKKTEREPLVAEPPQELPTRSHALAIAGWTTTGVLAGAAVLSGVMGLSQKGKLEELKESPDPDAGQLREHSNAASSWFLATDIFAAAAVVTAGASLYLTLRPPGRSAKATATRRAAAANSETSRQATERPLDVLVAPTRVTLRVTF